GNSLQIPPAQRWLKTSTIIRSSPDSFEAHTRLARRTTCHLIYPRARSPSHCSILPCQRQERLPRSEYLAVEEPALLSDSHQQHRYATQSQTFKTNIYNTFCYR